MKSELKIIFNPSSEESYHCIAPPDSASKCIPIWYKRSPVFDSKNIMFDEEGSIKNHVLKQCMPFIDSLTSGYIQKTWCDMHISFDDNELIIIQSEKSMPLFSNRQTSHVKVNDDYYPTEFVWYAPWMPETPKGYSCLFVNALNQFDLPFTTCSAIVDTDNFTATPWGRVPFYFKKNFTGIIPCGTPMYQIIPFKRDNWVSESIPYNEIKAMKIATKTRSYFYGFYKKTMWKKKSFK